MKKTIFALFIAAATFTTTSGFQKLNATNVSQSAPVAEKRTGTITEVTNNGGKLVDDVNGNQETFIHQGASVTFVVGDKVTYLKITLPNGNVIVQEIKRPA